MRTPPPRTAEQQKDAEREQALRIGTPATIRAWAQKHDVPLIGMDDDAMLLISIHEARAELFPTLSRTSREWLKQHRARIVVERETTANA
jgi:hypothetical protein